MARRGREQSKAYGSLQERRNAHAWKALLNTATALSNEVLLDKLHCRACPFEQPTCRLIQVPLCMVELLAEAASQVKENTKS